MVSKKLFAVCAILVLLIFGSITAYAVMQWDFPQTMIALVGVMASMGFFLVIVFSFIRARSVLITKLGQVQRSQDTLIDRVESLHKKSDKAADYAGSNLRLARLLPGLVDKCHLIGEQLTPNTQAMLSRAPHNEQGSSPQSQVGYPKAYFSPHYLPATPVLDKPNAHFPGRLAAAQQAQVPSGEKFEALLDSDEVSEERVVCVVGGTSICTALEEVASPRFLFPHYGAEQLDTEAGYLIIDEVGSDTSPWAGVFNSQGTHLLTKLLQIIELARQRRMVIIVLASRVLDHSSILLRNKADIVVDDAGSIEDLPWGEGLHLPVLDICMNFKRRQ